jgi:hypothetical protein
MHGEDEKLALVAAGRLLGIVEDLPEEALNRLQESSDYNNVAAPATYALHAWRVGHDFPKYATVEHVRERVDGGAAASHDPLRPIAWGSWGVSHPQDRVLRPLLPAELRGMVVECASRAGNGQWIDEDQREELDQAERAARRLALFGREEFLPLIEALQTDDQGVLRWVGQFLLGVATEEAERALEKLAALVPKNGGSGAPGALADWRKGPRRLPWQYFVEEDPHPAERQFTEKRRPRAKRRGSHKAS